MILSAEKHIPVYRGAMPVCTAQRCFVGSDYLFNIQTKLKQLIIA